MFKYKKIPAKAVEQAHQILLDYLDGKVSARKTHGKKHVVLSVGREYRLVNKGNYWELMNHNKYNKFIDKR